VQITCRDILLEYIGNIFSLTVTSTVTIVSWVYLNYGGANTKWLRITCGNSVFNRKKRKCNKYSLSTSVYGE